MVSYGAIALIVVVVAVLGYASAKSMNNGMKSLYSDQLLPLEQFGSIRMNIDRMWADAHRHLLVPGDRSRIEKEIAQATDETNTQINLFRAVHMIPEEKEWFTKFDAGWAARCPGCSNSFPPSSSTCLQAAPFCRSSLSKT